MEEIVKVTVARNHDTDHVYKNGAYAGAFKGWINPDIVRILGFSYEKLPDIGYEKEPEYSYNTNGSWEAPATVTELRAKQDAVKARQMDEQISRMEEALAELKKQRDEMRPEASITLDSFIEDEFILGPEYTLVGRAAQMHIRLSKLEQAGATILEANEKHAKYRATLRQALSLGWHLSNAYPELWVANRLVGVDKPVAGPVLAHITTLIGAYEEATEP